MEATKLVNRDVYEISYEGASGEGVVTARLTNTETGDVSDYVGADDGKFIVTVATGYEGESEVTIQKEGEIVDEGHVTFGEATPEPTEEEE